MSLINEALKKAQRVRHEDVAVVEEPAAPAGGTRIVRRGRAHSANTMILLASGGVVLVVLSVVITFFLVNRTPEPAPTTPAPGLATAALKPADPAAPSAGVAASKTETVQPPVAVTLPAVPPPSPVESAPAPATAVIAASNPPATVVVAPAPAAPPAKPDERVAVFVESIKVAGVRSSGNDSRVLMNERVYRVNDLVERTLGLKLIGVAADTLTFSDPAGATYVKQF